MAQLRNQFVNMTSTSTPALTTSYPSGAAVTAWQRIELGSSDDTTIFVQATRAAGAMTAVTFKLQIASQDVDAEYIDTQTVLSSTGMTDVEHTRTVGLGATIYDALMTANVRNAPFSRLLVRTVTANAAAGEGFQAFYTFRHRRDVA